MSQPTFHHVGVLVPDIERAIGWFSGVLGISFGPPERMVTHGRVDAAEFGDEEMHEGVSHLAWSIEGPPYYELAEAKPNVDGLHSLERHGVGLHHIGVFVEDVEAELERLALHGVTAAARVHGPDGKTLVCWTAPSPETGVVVEYIDEKLRGPIQAWIDTGTRPSVAATISPPTDTDAGGAR
jgi:catechol 2,3-dioxygenase-like lactoylglutathione lyase family enzyme